MKKQADLWVFGLAGVLYPKSLSVVDEVDHLMVEQIAIMRRIGYSSAVTLRKMWFERHNTTSTLVCVKKEGLDVDTFIRNTYMSGNINFLLQPNAALILALAQLKGRKVVLTGYPKEFAELMLFTLGLGQTFDDILGIEQTKFYLKPDVRAFIPVMDNLGMQGRVMFDCDPETLSVASRLGFHTVLVGDTKSTVLGVNEHVLRLEDYFFA